MVEPVITTDTPLPRGAELALGHLTAAFAKHQKDAGTAPFPILVGVAGSSPEVDEALAGMEVACPKAPESLVIKHLENGGLVVAGSDELGLAYAIAEVTEAIACAPPDAGPLAAVAEAVESPTLGWRSMQLFLCNRDLEARWYFDDDFWTGYLDQLRDCRYNNLSLTFGHQTPYLTPPYPFLVDMSDFTGVRCRGYTCADRERCLQALQRVGERTRERGLHFTVGIWSQRPEPFGEPMLDGLDQVDMAEFNAVGLERLLAACPQIDGVQFRMNYESGIAETGQAEFFERQIRAVAECGRPIRLDLRAKGLSDDVVRQAQGLVDDTVVSTKFWCEHLGQPYAMPAIKRADVPNYRRYGYWDLLTKPGRTPLIYRLWSAGSQRALLWGSSSWVRRFARACAAHTDGFEVMAPLSNKGGINHPGDWPLIIDRQFQPFAREYERYWMFYLLFGRLGYDPDAVADIWKRQLMARFGAAADAVDRAYQGAGEILPLLTTVLQSSASLWSFWPEMYAGRSLTLDIDVEPSDPTQFYGVGEYVEDALAGQLCGKWTPHHVADRLDELAHTCWQEIATADSAVDDGCPEYPGTRVDILTHACLASFHAERLRSMTNLTFFLRSGRRNRIQLAIDQFARARRHWQELIKLTDGVYHDNLVFGYLTDADYPEGLLSKDLNYRHDGHWKDRLDVMDADAAYLAETADQVMSLEADVGAYAGEGRLPRLPGVRCDLPKQVPANRELTFRLTTDCPLTELFCHHKAMLQSRPFSRRRMESQVTGSGETWADFQVTIPGGEIDGRWDLMLFFEMRMPDGEARRWPDWLEQAPYLVVETTRNDGELLNG